MRYGVNLFDLTKLSEIMLGFMVRPILTKQTLIVNKNRMDEICVMVKDEIHEDRIFAIFHFILKAISNCRFYVMNDNYTAIKKLQHDEIEDQLEIILQNKA